MHSFLYLHTVWIITASPLQSITNIIILFFITIHPAYWQSVLLYLNALQAFAPLMVVDLVFGILLLFFSYVVEHRLCEPGVCGLTLTLYFFLQTCCRLSCIVSANSFLFAEEFPLRFLQTLISCHIILSNGFDSCYNNTNNTLFLRNNITHFMFNLCLFKIKCPVFVPRLLSVIFVALQLPLSCVALLKWLWCTLS